MNNVYTTIVNIIDLCCKSITETLEFGLSCIGEDIEVIGKNTETVFDTLGGTYNVSIDC